MSLRDFIITKDSIGHNRLVKPAIVFITFKVLKQNNYFRDKLQIFRIVSPVKCHYCSVQSMHIIH